MVRTNFLLSAARRLITGRAGRGLAAPACRPTARRCDRSALAGPGDARQRLDRALDALFGVIDAHLPLLVASDQVFHQAKTASINFSEPFARLFEDGIADGSLAPPAVIPAETAEPTV